MHEREDIHMYKKCLTEYLNTQCTRLSREQQTGVIEIFNKIEKVVYEEMERRATAEGILRGYQMATAQKQAEQPTQMGYSAAVKAPKVGKRPVEKRDPECVVFMYPADESKTDAEETKRLVKETLAPKEKLQIRAFRKVTKGGVAVEAGTKIGATKIKELASRVPTFRLRSRRSLIHG